MDKSEQIDKLAAALSKAQSKIEDATKDKSGYGYKYADLSQILKIVRPLLSENGLSVCQFPGDSDGDSLSVDTILMHSSGQWISNKYSMKVEPGKGMTKAQAAGSVITYMRRYALAAIVGITQEDDDGRQHRKEESPGRKKPVVRVKKEYPQEKFSANFDAWKGGFSNGKLDLDGLIEKISEEWVLSPVQIAKIKSIGKDDG